MTPFDALVAHVRETCTPREWLYELSTFDRRMVATTAAARFGTEPVEPDTLIVRKVYDALCEPVSVLLGVGTCPSCDAELNDLGLCESCAMSTRPVCPVEEGERFGVSWKSERSLGAFGWRR